jgi:trehalose 6-phosphate synthase/phosphatase
MERLHSRILHNNVFRWGERFLASLEDAVSERGRYSDTQPKRLRTTEVLETYRRASRRLLMIDYDGTLVPFAGQPWQAVPPPVVMRLLTSLAAESHNCVAVTSGRTAEDLNRWFGAIKGLWLIAEHGAEVKSPLEASWEPLRSEVSTDWKSTVMPILEHFVDRTPGSFVEEKKYGVVWHYRMAEPEFGAWLANELVSMLEAMLAETELRAFRGDKVVEVKPVWANKGEALDRLLAVLSSPDFLFAAGDDRTDEDLFEHMPTEAWTVHIGPGPTRAAFVLTDFESLRRVLEMFTKEK